MAQGTVRSVGVMDSENFRSMENLQEIQRLPGLSPVNLNYFGSEQCERGYTFGPFVRTSYVLHMVKSGRGRLFRDGNSYEVRPGQAFLIYPGEETTYQADFYDPWCYMWVGFHGILADELVARAGFAPQSPVISCRNMDKMSLLMDQLLESRELTFVNELMRTGYLYQLMALLIDNGRQQAWQESHLENEEKLYVRTAVNLLINSDDPQMKVAEAARLIGISRGYLTRIFRKEMGVSPQEFQTRFRMEKAGDLLRSTGSPVSNIAEMLGYTDVLSFSKCFSRYYGMSPTAFRSQKTVVIRGEEKGTFVSEHPL